MGGADVIRQALAAGLVDELTIIIAPMVLGGGKRLFDGFSRSLDPRAPRRARVPLRDLHRLPRLGRASASRARSA
jgi:dihydrofolate reductase